MPKLELYEARGGVTDVRIELDVTPSEFEEAKRHQYVEFGGTVFKAAGDDSDAFLSIHPLKLKGS
jgi:hypothetical protein